MNTTEFFQQLDARIAKYDLLCHPFYNAWSAGRLTRHDLRRVMILDWDLPVLDGPEIMRIVRSPGVFPKPDLPIIMLTDVGERSRVHEAMQLGVHEVLVKPISPKTLQARLLGILVKPRPMVRVGNYYVPLPRRHVDFNELISTP